MRLKLGAVPWLQQRGLRRLRVAAAAAPALSHGMGAQQIPADDRSESGSIVGRGSAALEFLYGSMSGLAFGAISPLASQPFDVVKTRLQAGKCLPGEGPISVASSILKTEGVVGLYRGMLPILASTSVQKSALFAAYAGARRACEDSGLAALTQPLPLTGGLKPSILVGGIAAGTARAIVETPFELAKVRTQTGGSFRLSTGVLSLSQVKELYTGAFETWGRGTLMLTSFFVMCDYTEKIIPEQLSNPIAAGLIKGGVCATAAWAVAWPLEVAKSKVQSAQSTCRGESTAAILGEIARAEGMRGLYKGFLPGAARSFVANGVGMAVYSYTQSMRRD